MILILGKKIHFRENWLILLGIWGEAELFLGIWGAKANNFREKRKLFSGIWGDQCNIFRDLGSTCPPPPPGGGLYSVPQPNACRFPKGPRQSTIGIQGNLGCILEQATLSSA